jgi:hypothetical protein
MMKNWKMAFAAAAVAVAFSASDAAAQVRLSVAGGPSFPTGGDHHLETGFHVQLAGELGMRLLPFGVRLDGAFNRFNEDHGHFDVMSGTANAVINLPMTGLTPYIIAGGGLYAWEDEAHGGERTTSFGVNAGVGARLSLPGLGVFVEARVHNPFGDDALRFIPLSFGVRF